MNENLIFLEKGENSRFSKTPNVFLWCVPSPDLDDIPTEYASKGDALIYFGDGGTSLAFYLGEKYGWCDSGSKPEIKKVRVDYIVDGALFASRLLDVTDFAEELSIPQRCGISAVWMNGDEEYDFSDLVEDDLTLTAFFEDADVYTYCGSDPEKGIGFSAYPGVVFHHVSDDVCDFSDDDCSAAIVLKNIAEGNVETVQLSNEDFDDLSYGEDNAIYVMKDSSGRVLGMSADGVLEGKTVSGLYIASLKDEYCASSLTVVTAGG